MSDDESRVKLAAGGLVIDRRAGTPRVLVVHRPEYDDWSFPKGGVKDGESFEQAAVREVMEETGLACRILGRLSVTRYRVRTRKGSLRPKAVHYFLMECEAGEISTDGEEVDQACWLEIEEARRRLSYEHDKRLLDSIPG